MSVPIQLKIENWGSFFMQCLNNLAKKDEFCDFTIRSASNESFKVHRVVLNTCSDYFVSRPSTDKTMTIPVHLNFDAVKSVIKFMYTGQLNFTKDSCMSLIKVADMLQMTELLNILQSQNEANKVIPKYHSPQASISSTHSAIALNQYRAAKKPTTQINMTVKSPPRHTLPSTFINTMKAIDILSENKPMRFECEADDVPEFIEQTFELPKYDSVPLIKQDNCDGAKAMLKRASNDELINKSTDKNHKTISSPASKKLKIIVSDTDPENTVVDKILKKCPHLLQTKNNIKLKIISSTDQRKFESIIFNTVEKFLPAGSGVEKPITTHKVKPDIMCIIGPWSCNPCGTDNNPLQLDSYFTYRRHLVEKHNEKEDTKVCEYCGHFSGRKRLQIHHMYIKHNIQPPDNFKFPRCDKCGFIAITEANLKQHKCLVKCDIKPQTRKYYRNYTCAECDRMFCSSVILKEHLKNVHEFSDTIPSTSSTKKLSISVIDNKPPGAKVLTGNNIIVETDDLEKGEEVIYNEETDKSTIPVDIKEEWNDFDEVDANKN